MFILPKMAHTLAITVVEKNPRIEIVKQFLFFNSPNLLNAKPITTEVKNI